MCAEGGLLEEGVSLHQQLQAVAHCPDRASGGSEMGDDLAWGTQPVSTAATPLQTRPRRLSQNSASLPSVSCDLASGSLTEPWRASQPSTDTPAPRPPPPPWSPAGPQGDPVLCERRRVHTPCAQESAWLDPGPASLSAASAPPLMRQG